MAAALPNPSECCQQSACTQTSIVIVQTIPAPAAVDNLAALRAIPATMRVNNQVVQVLGEVTAFDGAGWFAAWRSSDTTPDGPPFSTLPNDLTPLDPGRWRQTA